MLRVQGGKEAIDVPRNTIGGIYKVLRETNVVRSFFFTKCEHLAAW
jgi:hypothetical protein